MKEFFITSTGSIGIKTSVLLTGVGINALTTNVAIGGVGVGVSQFTAAVDLQNAGLEVNRFVILPKVSTTQRNNLSNVVSGAVVYNTSVNQMEFYNGTQWRRVSNTLG